MAYVEDFPLDDSTLKDLARSTKALLLLQLQAQLKREEQEKPEITLFRAGFSSREIAELLGKTPAAIAKSIQRDGKRE
jgi:DNA-directed RNA polymerase specialized sigma24 family protein